MKILQLAPYVPVPPVFGGALRIYHLLKGLANRHEVTFVAFGDNYRQSLFEHEFGETLSGIHIVHPPWLDDYRRFSQFYAMWSSSSFFTLSARKSAMQNVLDELSDKNEYDLILIEFPHMAIFQLDTLTLKVLDEHNVEYYTFRNIWLNVRNPLKKLHYKREYQKVHIEEITACKKMDAILTVSERDGLILENETPGIPKFVVPNGVDTGFFVPSSREPSRHSLVFTGSMDYLPNNDAMNYFLDEIFPLITRAIPDTKVYIVGNHPPKSLLKRRTDNVVVIGRVEDVRPYVWNASAYVVPLRLGGGTRLKVLEALSMGKPVITTRIGSEGIDVVDGETALIREDPADFASAVVEVLKDPLLRQRLTANGSEFVRSLYDWEIITEKLDLVLASVAGLGNVAVCQPTIALRSEEGIYGK